MDEKLGAGVEAEGGCDVAGEGGDGEVLDDGAVGTGLGDEAEGVCGAGEVVVAQEGVQGDIDGAARRERVGVGADGAELVGGEIHGLGARGEGLKAEVDGVGAEGEGGACGVERAGGGEKFAACWGHFDFRAGALPFGYQTLTLTWRRPHLRASPWRRNQRSICLSLMAPPRSSTRP